MKVESSFSHVLTEKWLTHDLIRTWDEIIFTHPNYEGLKFSASINTKHKDYNLEKYLEIIDNVMTKNDLMVMKIKIYKECVENNPDKEIKPMTIHPIALRFENTLEWEDVITDRKYY